MHATVTKLEIIQEIEREFPVDPICFELLPLKSNYDETPNDILDIFFGKKWIEISLQDWSMLGSSIKLSSNYFTPESFVYFIPSILKESILSGDFQYAMDALVPNNEKLAARSEWWKEYISILTTNQKQLIIKIFFYINEVGEIGDSPQIEAAIALRKNFYIG